MNFQVAWNENDLKCPNLKSYKYLRKQGLDNLNFGCLNNILLQIDGYFLMGWGVGSNLIVVVGRIVGKEFTTQSLTDKLGEKSWSETILQY